MARKTRQPNVGLLKKVQLYLKKQENGKTDDKRRNNGERWDR